MSRQVITSVLIKGSGAAATNMQPYMNYTYPHIFLYIKTDENTFHG